MKAMGMTMSKQVVNEKEAYAVQQGQRKEMTAQGLNMSQSLMMKFANLNFMLQNLYTSIAFEEFSPFP